MRYDLKIKIGDIEMLEARDTSITENIPSAEPQITNVTLINNACSGTMTIGATASDMLQFDILNPYKTSFDGDIATLYVREQEDLSQSTLSAIEEAVGDATTSDVLSAEVETITSDYTEEEADIDAEDEADAEAVDATMESGLDALLEGEVPEDEPEDEGEDTDTEWTAVGVFYVYSQADNQDKSIRLTCYDGFSQMTGYYTPTNRTATISAMFADLQAKALANCEIAIDEHDFGDYASTSITWSIVTTYREALSYFAGIAGGFAEFLPNGHVGISKYSFDDNNVISDELIGYQESSAGEMVVEGIECNLAPGELVENIIESGEGGQALHFANPFITQAMLDDIAADYLGIRFTGAKFTTDWNTNMTAGEFVRVFSKAEYENYLKLRNNVEQNSGSMSADELARIKAGMNALGRVALISTQTITFKGGAFTAVTSICDSEAEKASTPLGPTDAKFRKVYAEVVETRELVAGKATIADLQAAEARIGTLETDSATVTGRLTAAEADIESLEADHVSTSDLTAATGRITTLETDNTSVKNRLTAAEADIDTLEADHVKVSDLTAVNANITALQTGKADIDAANITTATLRDAWVDKILVQSGLIAHTGTIYSLDAIQVNASNIKAGTLDVERLIVTQNGQKYLVHVDGTTTTYEKLDGNIIEDLTITADKIVAGAITAQKITTENLVGTGGWINLRNGTFNYVNATSGQGISWNGTNLTISGVVNITSGNVYTKTEADENFLPGGALSDIEALVSGGYIVYSETEGVNVDKETFLAQFEDYEELAESYAFTKSGSTWKMDGATVDLATYGIAVESSITSFIIIAQPVTGLTAESDNYEARITTVEDRQDDMSGDVTALQFDVGEVSDRQTETANKVDGIDDRLETAEDSLGRVVPVVDKITKQVDINPDDPSVTVRAGTKSVVVTEEQVQFKDGSAVQAYAGSESFVAPSLQTTQILMRTKVSGELVGGVGQIMRSNGHFSIKKITGGE